MMLPNIQFDENPNFMKPIIMVILFLVAVGVGLGYLLARVLS